MNMCDNSLYASDNQVRKADRSEVAPTIRCRTCGSFKGEASPHHIVYHSKNSSDNFSCTKITEQNSGEVCTGAFTPSSSIPSPTLFRGYGLPHGNAPQATTRPD